MKKPVKILVLSLLLYIVYSCNGDNKNKASSNFVETLLSKGQNYSLPDSIREQYFDTIYSEIKNHNNDSLSRYYYRQTESGYYNLQLYDKSLTVNKRLYSLAQNAGDTLAMARSLYHSADSYYGKAKMDSAFYYYSQAQVLYKDLKELSLLGEVILYKAYVYYNIGEYALCETEAIKALNLLEKQNKTIHIFNCLNLIATALDGQNNSEQSIKYYKSALMQLEKLKEQGYSDNEINSYKTSCLNNMGGVYVKMQEHTKAISIYKEALNLTDLEEENPSLYAKVINNLAYAKFKLGEHSDLPQLYLASLKIRDSLNNKSGIVASNINLGEYYALKQDTIQAISYLKKANAQANEIKSHYDILNSLKLLSEIDKKHSTYYYNRYIAVNDSLQEIAKQNRDKFARIEYETDKLQDEKEALLKRNSFIIGISAVILLFIAAIFIIYYLNSRNKELLLVQEQQKANEEIYQLMFEQQSKIDSARKEEKNRIAMELHDGILNNIYAVRLNLEFINKKADEESILKRKEFIKELQNIETEIRSVSHELSRSADFNQDKNFKNMIEFMVLSQKNKFDTDFEAVIDDTIDWESISNFCKVNIYRIIQESLQNINKYAQAKLAVVKMEGSSSDIKITVTDNGQGFDVEKAKGGIGLKNLKERASAINATIKITSKPGQGTIVQVLFPI